MCYGTALQSKQSVSKWNSNAHETLCTSDCTYDDDNMNDQQNLLMGMCNRNGKGSHITLNILQQILPVTENVSHDSPSFIAMNCLSVSICWKALMHYRKSTTLLI